MLQKLFQLTIAFKNFNELLIHCRVQLNLVIHRRKKVANSCILWQIDIVGSTSEILANQLSSWKLICKVTWRDVRIQSPGKYGHVFLELDVLWGSLARHRMLTSSCFRIWGTCSEMDKKKCTSIYVAPRITLKNILCTPCWLYLLLFPIGQIWPAA